MYLSVSVKRASIYLGLTAGPQIKAKQTGILLLKCATEISSLFFLSRCYIKVRRASNYVGVIFLSHSVKGHVHSKLYPSYEKLPEHESFILKHSRSAYRHIFSLLLDSNFRACVHKYMTLLRDLSS
jgi:hypothetical protein